MLVQRRLCAETDIWKIQGNTWEKWGPELKYIKRRPSFPIGIELVERSKLREQGWDIAGVGERVQPSLRVCHASVRMRGREGEGRKDGGDGGEGKKPEQAEENSQARLDMVHVIPNDLVSLKQLESDHSIDVEILCKTTMSKEKQIS